MNLFQVLNYNDLKDIFDDNSDKLVLIMFSMKTCQPCKNIKPKFVELSKKEQSCLFIYIDVENFLDSQFISGVTSVPRFSFYYDSEEIASQEGANYDDLVKALNDLKIMIEHKKKEIMSQELNKLNKKNKQQEKIVMLKKLHDLTKKNIKLTNSYTLSSDLDDMIWEYNLHTNPDALVVGGNNVNENGITDISRYKSDDIDEKLNKSESNLSLISVQSLLSPQISPDQSPVTPIRQTNNLNNGNNSKEQLELIEKYKKIQDIQRITDITKMQQARELYKMQQLMQLKQLKEQQEKLDSKKT
jgi:thiol-disulfide isomerase/thioredoxin